jgi:RsiW-degrading membrane proteinase PrsW (M82 family)
MRYALIYAGSFTIGAVLTGGVHATYHGQPLWVVIVVYLLGGLFVGCCIDLIHRVVTARWQASLLGFFVALPLAFGAYLLFLPGLPPRMMAIATGIGALIYGGLYGAILWDPPDTRLRRT